MSTAPQSVWTKDKPPLHLALWSKDGPPLLLTHGMAANTHWWDGVAPSLAKNFSVAALDFEGHGESAWREDGNYSPEGFCRNIEAARAFLGVERMIIGAHSMGARAAIDYAAAHARRVQALILVDFLADSYETKAFRFEKLQHRPQPVYSDDALMRERFRLEPPGTLLKPDELRPLAGHSLKKTDKGFTWKFNWRAFSCRYPTAWATLPRIAVPTVVIRGEKSTVMSREDLARVLREIKGARGLEIPRAHHHVPLDCPEETARAIIDCLDEILR